MPSITEQQWQAVRRTAAAVAREAAHTTARETATKAAVDAGNQMSAIVSEHVSNLVEGFDHRLQALELRAVAVNTTPPSQPIPVFSTYKLNASGGINVVAPVSNDAPGVGFYSGGFSGPCPMKFKDPECSKKNSRHAKPKVTGPHHALRDGTKAPPSLPASDFYTVCDARCYPYGGSPEHNLPWLISPGKVMHGSEVQALDEAERLAKENNVPYVVLHATHIVKPVAYSTPSTVTHQL